MIIYIIIYVILLFLYLFENAKNRSIVLNLSLLIFFLLLVGHNGKWGDVGIDYEHYMNLFLGKNSVYGNVYTSDGYELEWPFYYFIKLLNIFPRTSTTYIIAISLTICIPFFYIIKKESSSPPLTLLLLLILSGSKMYLFFFAAHRQILAISFFLWMLIIQRYYFGRCRKILLILFALLGLLSHSTSYFILSLMILVHFVKFTNKKNIYIALIASCILGFFFQFIFNSYLNEFIYTLKGITTVERTTHYLIDNVFEYSSFSFSDQVSLTIIALLAVYGSSIDNLNNFGVKSIIFAAIFFNILFSIPLIDRMLLFFILIGISMGLPEKSKTKRFKILYGIIVLFLIRYTIYVVFQYPGYGLIPYHFFYE